MRMRYTEHQLEFLRKGYLAMRVPALTEAFNAAFGFALAPSAIKATLRYHKFRCGRPRGFAKGERLTYTMDQIDFLRTHYPQMNRTELIAAFNEQFGTDKKAAQIVPLLKRYGIKSGRDARFEAGRKPWNAGTKGMGLTSANSGSFKPGNEPWTTKPMGYERIDDYGYILVKVAEKNPYTGHPARFKHKHLVVWEAANGPIPKGHKVRFLDGNKLNCSLENLELVSNAEHLHMNRVGYSEVPPEFKPVAKTLIKLEVTTFRHLKESRS